MTIKPKIWRKYMNPPDMTLPSRVQSRAKVKNKRKQPPFWKIPKRFVLFILILLMAVGGGASHEYHGFVNAGIAVVTAVIIDIGFAFQQKRKRMVPDGAALTGLIIALVLSSTTPWYLTAATAAIAIVSKHVLKVRKKPIFNPAAFGLLASIGLFSTDQSWWGSLPMLPAWCIILVIGLGYLVAGKVNKFPQVFSFLGMYLLLLLTMGIYHFGDAVDALRIPFISSALFLAFFMLTDPPTSPSRYGSQIFFGVLTAIVGAAVYAFFGGLTYLFIGLLLANAWNAVRIKITAKD
jgi:enediyne biosynthesis protein E5